MSDVNRTHVLVLDRMVDDFAVRLRAAGVPVKAWGWSSVGDVVHISLSHRGDVSEFWRVHGRWADDWEPLFMHLDLTLRDKAILFVAGRLRGEAA